MKCPYCQEDNDKVIDSRSGDEGYAIRRRRECLACSKRFTTFERVVELDIRVVKKGGERERFQPDKIRKGLERACWKRPIPTDKVEEAITRIVRDVYSHDSSEIDAETIGTMVMDQLMKLDDVAYIRFASVYRQFKDIHDFVDEVRPMLDREKSKRLKNAKNS
jgi:transcriptional repressor NrdR